jgi:hypothetical protein
MTFVKGTTLWHVVRSIGHEITTVCGRHLSADMPTANGLGPAPRRAEAHLEGVPPPPGSRNPGNRLLQCRNDPATDPVTCCCSSRSGPGGYMSLVSPDTPARRGSPSRRGTWRWGAARADPVPDPGSGLQVLRSFDEVFLTEGVKVIQTPIQAPRTRSRSGGSAPSGRAPGLAPGARPPPLIAGAPGLRRPLQPGRAPSRARPQDAGAAARSASSSQRWDAGTKAGCTGRAHP